MTFVAIQNFRGVDRMLAAPAGPAAKWISATGPDGARQVLRYQVSELNRFFFENWERAQIGLGLLICGTLLVSRSAARPALILSGLMLVIVVAMHLLITPRIVGLGRVIDFVPAGVYSAERAQFWRMHHLYSGLEVFKLVLGLGLAVMFLMGRGRRAVPRQVDSIDHAHHRHVNG